MNTGNAQAENPIIALPFWEKQVARVDPSFLHFSMSTMPGNVLFDSNGVLRIGCFQVVLSHYRLLCHAAYGNVRVSCRSSRTARQQMFTPAPVRLCQTSAQDRPNSVSVGPRRSKDWICVQRGRRRQSFAFCHI